MSKIATAVASLAMVQSEDRAGELPIEAVSGDYVNVFGGIRGCCLTRLRGRTGLEAALYSPALFQH